MCASSAGSAESGTPFFEGDTPTRFDSNSTLPPIETEPNNTAPQLSVSKFNYIDFDQAESETVSLQEVENLASVHRRDRGGQYTLAELNDLVSLLTRYYRDQGFVLARVILPEQTIENGVLSLQLVVGKLESVNPTNNDHYSNERLTTLLEPHLGEAVQEAELEQTLFRLSDYPGIDVRTSLAAGQEPGTTMMQLDVMDEDVWGAHVAFDNYGSENTGQYRLTLASHVNNPTDRADLLSGQLRFSVFPANSVSGLIRYQIPLDSQDLFGPPVVWKNTDFSLGISASAFELSGDLEVLDIEGGSRQMFLRTDRTLARTREARTTVFQSVSFKRSQSDQNDSSLGDDRLTVLELGGTWQGSDTFLGRSSNQVQASIGQGVGDFLGSMKGNNADDSSRVGQDGDRAGGNFTVVRFTGERLQSVGDQYLSLRSTFQWSPSLLTSLEHLSFGGNDTVRGYPAGDRRADTGLVFNLEYFGYSSAPELTLPVSQLRLAAFWDFGFGQLNEALPNETASPSAMSVGVYTDFKLARQFQARLDLAIPFGAQAPSDGRSFSVGFQLSRVF